MAIPSDALMNHSRPPIGNGARSSATIRSAMRRVVRLADRVEDDPELVATEAGDGVARAQAAIRRCPTATRSRSPTAWPTLSLITLNRSRSSRMTAIGSASSAPDEARACAIRSVSSSRLGRPVVGS